LTALGPPRERRPARRRRRARRVRRAVVRLLVAAALVAAGVAVGEALHDNPRPGETRTILRNLRPLPLPPVRETVTVTAPNTTSKP
jgi:hypothetical protein